MKKSYIYILLIILLLITIPIFNNNDDKTFNIDGIRYSISVDGVSEDSFPEKGSYDVNVSCSNVVGTWNYNEWVVEIPNIGEDVFCDISFISKSTVYLNNHIKNTLTGTTQGNGQVVNENGYRYEGKNPNNYIKFNDELWRIIGVFDEDSHGQTGEYLTKIIRDESIGGLVWYKNDTNNWANSSLKSLLNGAYYNAEDGTDSGYCYGYSTSVTKTCDYRVGGIQEEYRSMIKNVTWYLGGYSSNSVTTDNMYTYERSTSDTYYYTDNRNNKTVTGNIGLMYVSDYGYSVLSSSCARTTTLNSYGSSSCAGNSWLYGNGYEWTIGHYSSSWTSVFAVYYTGHVSTNGASRGYATRPVLYLDSSVYIINGTGSKSDPYVIGM